MWRKKNTEIVQGNLFNLCSTHILANVLWMIRLELNNPLKVTRYRATISLLVVHTSTLIDWLAKWNLMKKKKKIFVCLFRSLFHGFTALSVVMVDRNFDERIHIKTNSKKKTKKKERNTNNSLYFISHMCSSINYFWYHSSECSFDFCVGCESRFGSFWKFNLNEARFVQPNFIRAPPINRIKKQVYTGFVRISISLTIGTRLPWTPSTFSSLSFH